MARCQCWLTVNCTQTSYQLKSQYRNFFFQENAIENVACKMSTIFVLLSMSHPQNIRTHTSTYLISVAYNFAFLSSAITPIISCKRLLPAKNKQKYKDRYLVEFSDIGWVMEVWLPCYPGAFQKHSRASVANLGVLKFSLVNKLHIFYSINKIFCVEFQRVYLKFHTKYLTHTLKDTIFIQCWKLKSCRVDELVCIFETPPGFR